MAFIPLLSLVRYESSCIFNQKCDMNTLENIITSKRNRQLSLAKLKNKNSATAFLLPKSTAYSSLITAPD